MAGMQQSKDSVITVEGTTYVLKVGGENRPMARLQDAKWYVVAFPRESGRRQVPLAGPFGTKSEAAGVLESYLNQPSYPAGVCERIKTFKSAS